MDTSNHWEFTPTSSTNYLLSKSVLSPALMDELRRDITVVYIKSRILKYNSNPLHWTDI